jgi:AAA domain
MTLSLGEIIQALGGDALSLGQVSVPGPGRSAGDRSLLIWLSSTAPDGFELESLVGDDINACRDYVRQRVGLAPFAPKANGERATREGDAAAPDGLIAHADKYAPGTTDAPRPKFVLEPFNGILFDAKAEWLVKQILPRQGVVAIYGRFGSFKSFIAADIAFSVAYGKVWAGRRVTGAPVVYIAAEGAAGFRKRMAGIKARGDVPPNLPFFLIGAAPNLGTDKGDLETLAADIESAGAAPGLIVLDTLAATLASADENGAGMVQFVANANALACRFKALVLVVHHVGLSDERRMRGHSSFAGGADALLLCERCEGELSAHLTSHKLKDEASNICLAVTLCRVVIGEDEDGDEISTLVVDNIEPAPLGAAKGASAKKVPPSLRLLIEVVAQAEDEAGETLQPWPDGPLVKAVNDDEVRCRYYARIAEQAGRDDDPKKLAARQRQAFRRSVKSALDQKLLVAVLQSGIRFLRLPDASVTPATPLKGGVA